MKKASIVVAGPDGKKKKLPLAMVHTLVVGSGAAGLNTAVQLRANGIDDVLILTEGLKMGTSINTGSDKQTYYKLAMCGADADAPRTMAETYFSGGSMHGDLSLVEASLSARAFVHLVNLGIPFPRDAYGQFVGYKTDHDPRQRATSVGPYTSREMCRALIRRVKELKIPVLEDRIVAQLLVTDAVSGTRTRRVAGVVALNSKGTLEVYGADNVVFATGGPGGLYKTSVYPNVHTGAIGVGLMAGAKAQSLPESQYGMASTKFRWNVSGTYMQVIPRFISTSADGKSDAKEFMGEYFGSVGEMNSMVFLKGYQWPFDSRKTIGGSSIVDIIVYIETVIRKRRVFLDFRGNPAGFKFEDLNAEALDYLKRSNALQSTPILRLRQMNPGAVELYSDHGIDITKEPLEIAVCAQHNNGGLAGNHWWESVNIAHLFPVGEVNGSHGVYRPGGSALNSGQVGGFRAAEYIANVYRKPTAGVGAVKAAAAASVPGLQSWIAKGRTAKADWKAERAELQERMSRAGAHIRSKDGIAKAIAEAREQNRRIEQDGIRISRKGDLREALITRYLCFAHRVYLESLLFQLESGVGSRGSAVTLDPGGEKIHGKLSDEWRMVKENPDFRDRVLETDVKPDGTVANAWVARRQIPESDSWFETAWARFRSGEVYRA